MANLCALAESAEREGDQASASAVLNQAALLVSDVGLPDLARQWCHRHAEVYLRALPMGAQAARRGLEPLVNLARLHIRAGDGPSAFALLGTLYQAITFRSDTVIDGIPVPAATLIASEQDHHELRQWLWTVHVADSARALVAAGHWQDAHAHLRRNRGIGQRMLDGRQVAVIAHTLAGEPDTALALLDETAPGEPWENAVTACLTVLCRRTAGQPIEAGICTMLEHYQRPAPTGDLSVFATRLGLSVIDAAGGTEDAIAFAVATKLIEQTLAFRDGYAARDVLAHKRCATVLSVGQTRALAELVEACALGSGTMPPEMRASLSDAVATSEAVITPGLRQRAVGVRPLEREHGHATDGTGRKQEISVTRPPRGRRFR
ncbi:hypothetical protein [Sphaerisporangium album]|uniref:hypothetical protein n=1 Tax=Sphaerisporangium album TaxID=509200 RepID=UPI0015F0C64C|nr:hypothetical protein [Sphaerisporangium album]